MVGLLVVTPFGRRLGGSDNILLSFLRSYDPDLIRPSVAVLEPGPFAEEISALGVRVHVLPQGRLRNPAHTAATWARLARLIRRESPDLLLNWLSTAQLYGGPAAAILGRSGHCVWWQLDQHSGPRWSRGRLLDRLATALPSVAVGCCSEAVAAAQSELWPRRPVLTVLPGIPEPVVMAPSERLALAEGLGLPSPRVVVGTIGRLFRWKGHHHLLRAVRELRRRGHPAHALIVGGGGHRADLRYEAELRALADDPDLRGAVTFTGQVPDASRYASLMDVFVNASNPEPFGLVLVEAMAAERPVVAVASGGPLEIVEPGVSGTLAPDSSPGSLVAALEPLVMDPALRRRMGRAGRLRYEARFTERRMGLEMSRRLAELVA